MTDQFNLHDVLEKYVSKPSEASKPEFIVLYGRPGGGKTWLGASASELPHVRKMLILDTEGSTVGTLSDFDDSKVDIVQVAVRAKEAGTTPFLFLNSLLKHLFDPNAEHEYDVVMIDTLDKAQEWAVDHFKETAPYTKSGEKDGYWTWGQVSDWTVKEVGENLRHAPFLAIVTVHEKEEKTTDGALVKGLRLQGSAKDTWPGIPDVVAYLERKLDGGEPTTFAYFETDDNKVTKNRFKFPPKVKDVTIPKLFKYIEDRKKEDK